MVLGGWVGGEHPYSPLLSTLLTLTFGGVIAFPVDAGLKLVGRLVANLPTHALWGKGGNPERRAKLVGGIGSGFQPLATPSTPPHNRLLACGSRGVAD